MNPKPTDDYGHGQMMGMLSIITLIENLPYINESQYGPILQNVKRAAATDLSEYLKKPEEDVYLMVEKELKELI